MCQLLVDQLFPSWLAHWSHLGSFKEHLRCVAQASRDLKLAQGDSNEHLGWKKSLLWTLSSWGQDFHLCTSLEHHATEHSLLIETRDTKMKVLTVSSYGRMENTWALTSKTSVFAS